MNKAIVGHMDADEFEAMIETFIKHRSGEDDRLSAQTFFQGDYLEGQDQVFGDASVDEIYEQARDHWEHEENDETCC
jgi:hypothetical protein